MARKNKILYETEITSMVNWAIVSHLKPHQLAYRINEKCTWDLQRLKNLNANAKTKAAGFVVYTYQQNHMQPDFYLVALKDDKHILVKDLKQFDYILQARLPDEDTKWEGVELMHKIKSIENVLGVFDINLETIKNSNALYFDKQLDELEEKVDKEKRKEITRIVK
jgi:hydroxymethylpyrimidine pyrophosphatase-like HAD family hydrolase